MSSKEFVNSIMKDDNIGAEEAFTSAMSDKVSDALEKKRIELSRAYVSQPQTQEQVKIMFFLCISTLPHFRLAFWFLQFQYV